MLKRILGVLIAASLFTALAGNAEPTPALKMQVDKGALSVATFAGGCFWCTESDFEKIPGVREAISGYTGGTEANPTYKLVSSGRTKHIESVEVYYDPAIISYEGLLEAFWRMVNPTDSGGQFVDRGYQYTTAIFYHSDDQRLAAEKSKAAQEISGRHPKKVITPIRPASVFYNAEKYHQNYHEVSSIRYKFYRYNSGRDQYLKTTWGKDIKINYAKYNSQTYTKPNESEIRNSLTPLQFKVTQNDATERPFNNEFWNEKRDGIYVDIVTGEPLFSSRDKFKSGTGWPSFTRPLVPEHVVETTDYKLIYPRTEVRSKFGDSHLGHVFSDGPAPTGLRYCINSAALKFIPTDELQTAGYENYVAHFR